jgi:NADH dehydrogenase (ubiquinone) 1 beta subcomplex subunit 9
MTSTFSSAHRLYVKSLYKRFLNNELNWTINRAEWRSRALAVRAEFERHRYVYTWNLASSVLYTNIS